MSQIDELQSRIAAAMDRIGQGLDDLSASAGPQSSAETDALRLALDEERLANSQLHERVNALKAKLDNIQNDVSSQHDTQAATAAKLDLELNRLRKANTQLRESNSALREANEQGVGEPHLINKAMLAELQALRAVRAADAAETQAIMGLLEPLIDSASKPQQEDA